MSTYISVLRRSLLEKFLLPLGDLATRQKVMTFYGFYRSAQWWDRDRLSAWQDRKLEELIQTVTAEVPFYKELYEPVLARGFQVKGRQDLSRLPVVTKAMLKRGYPEQVTRNTRWPVSQLFTSGSSGEPFAVLIDNLTLSAARALMLLRANFSGWQIGDPLLQTGMSIDRGAVKRIKDLLLRTRYFPGFNLSSDALDGGLEILQENRIRYLMGYPVSLYLLARRARETGFNHQLDGIVTWGDNVFRHYRQLIEGQFRTRVTDTYGCGEGIQIAAQCAAGAYHVFMPHVLVEIVDDDGNPTARGERGHILLTRLEPGAMPLIRYRVGDMGRLSAAGTCPCGRGLEMLAGIEGRDTVIVLTPGGNRLIVHFFTGILEYFPTVDNFQVRQEEVDSIDIRIVPGEGFAGWELEKIEQEIRQKGDRDLAVRFELVDRIEGPAEGGKRRFVVSSVRSG